MEHILGTLNIYPLSTEAQYIKKACIRSLDPYSHLKIHEDWEKKISYKNIKPQFVSLAF